MVKFRTLCRSAIVICIWNGFSALGTVYDSDGSAASVQGLQNAALDGDTITLPSGTFTWTTQVHLTKAITLKGNTTTDPVNGTAVQNTIVKDNISNRNNHIIYIDAANGGHGGQRITGIAFIGQNSSTMYNGAITVDGGTDPIRIDHCYFHGLHCFPTIGIFVQNWGVLDHNVKDDSVTGNEGFCHFWPYAHTDLGDSAFEHPIGFGGPNWLFIEDNFTNGGTDITAGGKMVFRHNIVTNNNSNGSHGTARTFPNGRGGRGYEIYNNEYRYTNNWSSLDGIDGGSALYYNNTVTPHTQGFSCQVYRLFQSYGSPFGLADGNNAWDLNDANHHVLRVLDQPGLGAGNPIDRNHPAWPNQLNEPIYSWNNHNLDDGSSFNITLGEGGTTMLEGRDYFNNTPMPGYVPYTYPHPLTGGGPSPSPSPSPTATPTPAPSPTSPPSPTPTATPTPRPSSTPTATPAATATPTATATPKHTPRPHPSHAPD